MSWRTVYITHRCKLDLRMGYLVVRGEETKKVFLDEIALLVIENPAVSLTGCLLEALTEKKIKVLFCDTKRNPVAELMPLYGSHDTSAKVRSQIAWSEEVKGFVWTAIVAEKIRNQARLLAAAGKTAESDKLLEYIDQLEFRDASNREGHAAKVYFNALFGMRFSRNADSVTNAALNYGYSLLLSAVNREITSAGYLTQIGLFHDNMFNHFNLGSDLMEPFRPLVDRHVYEASYTQFDSEQKRELAFLLHKTVTVDHTQQTVLNALRIYVKSVFDTIENADYSVVRFASYI